MNLTTKLQWEIRQGYINTLLRAGVKPQWLQMELPYLSNDQMADLIKSLIKLGVIESK